MSTIFAFFEIIRISLAWNTRFTVFCAYIKMCSSFFKQ